MTPTKVVRSSLVLATVFLLIGAGSALSTDRALLVGVSDYPTLDKEMWLLGPTNDVSMMEELLCSDKFGFAKENMTILSGWPKDEKLRPTKENIRKAFDDLATKSKAGDTCFILMSGHGSQQPINKQSDDIENDGFDEIFIPADIGEWDDTKKTVSNAIVDDEVKKWVKAITDKDALVWIIFDSCHSGTMTRELSLSGRKARQLNPEDLIPAAELKKAAGGKATRNFGTTKSHDGPGVADGNSGGLVAMYAAQSLEPTFELPLPTPENRRHGLFTYTMAQILAGAESDMTFAELAESIQTFYLANGVYQPTPMIEGSAIRRSVRTHKNIDDRPAFLLGNQLSESGFNLRAGALHGLTEDTILEVFPPPGSKDADQSVGYVKVYGVKPFSAMVSAASYNSKAAPAPNSLAYGCRCEIAYQPHGSSDLKIAVQEQDQKNLKTYADGKAPAPLENELAMIAKNRPGLFTRTGSAEEANWFARIEGSDVVLIPASGWSPATSGTKEGSSAPPAFKVATLNTNGLADSEIESALIRISKARQLLNITGMSELKKTRLGATDINVELVRYANGGAGEATPVPNEGAGRILTNGDTIAFRITNPSPHPVDVTLLFMDASFGITSIFPEHGTLDDNRLAPGQVFTTEPMEVTVETVGLEQVIAIGVRATRDRQSFTCLEQPTLERTRGDSGMDSPLGELLKSSVYGQGNTRGLAPSQLDAYKMRLLNWQTRK